jgi:hypothetical protein
MDSEEYNDETLPKGMSLFFAGVSAAKEKERCSLRPLRLCGERVALKRYNRHELEHLETFD